MEYSFSVLFVVFMPQVQFRFKLFSYSSVILDQQNNLIFKDLGSSYFFFYCSQCIVVHFVTLLCFDALLCLHLLTLSELMFPVVKASGARYNS